MTADRANEASSGPAAPAKIIIADDHPLVCAALTHTLRAAMPCATVLTAASLSAVEAALAEHPDLDLALLDLHMPGARGFSVLLLLRGQRPELPVIVVSSNDHPRTIARARQFGAAGFLPKSAPIAEMLAAIASVMAGGACFPRHEVMRCDDDAKLAAKLAQLTPQQMRVLMCIADGLLNKQIAHELRLAENTVKVHVAAVLHKLGCHTRTHAALLAKCLEAEGPAPHRIVPEAIGAS
ncbi:MAG: response regulator transcription factor [Proteobacteria bacterium]|nr:response regulator transcription factor [Pseudomonadota bacterium]